MTSYKILLVFIFIIKIYARTNLFNITKEKYGHDTLRLVRRYEKLCVKLGKLNSDLKFLLCCKNEKLTPTFARPKLSIYTTKNIKSKIARVIIQTEIQNKHRLKKQLKIDLRKITSSIKVTVSEIFFQALRYRIRNVICSKENKWSQKHDKKLQNLRACIPAKNKATVRNFAPKVIHNFSSYSLSPRELESLSYSLDYAIPGVNDTRSLEVEFENFYQKILPHTTHLSESDKRSLKTRTLTIFNQYDKINCRYEDIDVVRNLSKNKDICIMKQDKGRGVVIVDKTDYIKKCEVYFTVINSKSYQKIQLQNWKGKYRGLYER